MKVLIAVDASQGAQKACNWYYEHVHVPDNEVCVFSHMDKPSIPGYVFGGVTALLDEEVQRTINEHEAKMRDLEEKYVQITQNQPGNSCVIVQTADGGPGHSIVAHAENYSADLIVTGTRGLGTIRRTVLGSVSDYVLHHAKIPVLICHM